MIGQFSIEKSCFEGVREYCGSEYPNVACGLLGGKDGKTTHFFPVKNVSSRPMMSCIFDAEDKLRVFEEMKSEGLEMIGVYYSHIGTTARPSARDLEMVLEQGIFHVVLSVEPRIPPSVKVFSIDNGLAVEKPLIIVGPGENDRDW